jgi:uncharacterized protein YndB with AHSA1/START domain/uncharacterized protein YciI
VSTVSPIRREILVDANPETAFEVFTARVAKWWPVADKSVYGAGTMVAFEDGQILERSADGQVAVWGTITRWEPPQVLAFTWHPGYGAERASHVEITFAARAGQTLVTVEHTGWEAFADPAAARAEYNQGWPLVLDCYREYAAGAGDGEPADGEPADGHGAGDTWVALLHRPGPAAPPAGTLMQDPRFAEHVAFLARMHEQGYLVAAGPMLDAEGEGMTILRLPGTGQLGTATRLATQDDASVVAGLLAVTVRPWQVMLAAQPG